MASAVRYLRAQRHCGQAMVEYLVGLLVIFVILFDVEAWGGRTAVDVLLEAFQRSHHGYEYAQSQPVLD